MINTLSLVNICHHGYKFLSLMRTFKVYSLSNFQICSTELLISHQAGCHIPTTYLQLEVCTFLLPSPILPTLSPPPLASINLFSIPMSSVFALLFCLDSTYR